MVHVRTLTSSKSDVRTRLTQGFALDGFDFTLVAWEKCEPDFAQQLSKQLNTTATYLWSEDTSGWTGYSIFKVGEELEAFQYGPSYEDELEEFPEELAEAPPTPTQPKKRWDVSATKSGEAFQFRSKLMKPAGKELYRGLGFIDARFKALSIPIPRNFPEEQEALSFPDDVATTRTEEAIEDNTKPPPPDPNQQTFGF